jgi:hypothetical protein
MLRAILGPSCSPAFPLYPAHGYVLYLQVEAPRYPGEASRWPATATECGGRERSLIESVTERNATPVCQNTESPRATFIASQAEHLKAPPVSGDTEAPRVAHDAIVSLLARTRASRAVDLARALYRGRRSGGATLSNPKRVVPCAPNCAVSFSR